MIQEYHHIFPTAKEEILALPGLGESTTDPVMTSAICVCAPIVDTNVNRVLTRVFIPKTTQDQAKKSEYSKILWCLSEATLPQTQFWEFNQGIMDFGAIQCTSIQPKCKICPMRSFCLHYQRNSLTRFF